MKPKGRHPDKALSALKIRTLEKQKKPGRYADGNGLYLIVDPTGATRWVLRTVVQGKRRDLGLGSTRLVSLTEAREEALKLRKVARFGGDPLSERRMQRRHVPTFEEAAKIVHADRSGAWKNKKHAVQWLTALADYAFPSLGSRRVDQISTPDVLMVLSPIWLSKPETARRVRQRIRAVMDWAGAAGHRSGANPVDGVEKGLPRQQDRDNHHSALEYDDVPQFLSDLRQSDAGEVARLAFEFLILTATRTRETTEAKWSEVDFKAKTWTISASRMKTARNHRVPLSPRAIEILTRAKELSAVSEYIFPGRRPEQPLSDATLLKALRRMRSDITTHGFRSTFRDWAAERTNFSREVCEQALAHIIEDKTEAAYRRGDLFEKRRELMDAWAAFATGAKGTVIHLHSGRGR